MMGFLERREKKERKFFFFFFFKETNTFVLTMNLVAMLLWFLLQGY